MRNTGCQLLKGAVSRQSEDINLASAALFIAIDEYPNLNVHKYLKEIQGFADQIRPQLHARRQQKPIEVIDKMSQHLFVTAGFRGNRESYFDPRNSFLNEVLDRRLGIPITLSVIYMEVGKRLGLKLHGVGMPGHFLVKCLDHGTEIFVDPFNGGEILLESDCHSKLSQIHGENLLFDRVYLNSINNHQILTRMLTNLKRIYLKQQDHLRALAIVEKLLVVNPNAPPEIRDRGFLYYKLNQFSQALNDWQHYLDLSPNAPDVSEIERNLTTVGHLLALRN
jgi:regulator of sirC expression with transglutaminase-like and TPR domain